MKILTDLHIHTNITPDAYSTINEHITFAAKKGLELLAITNHSPNCFKLIKQEDSFANMVVFPKEIEGITIIRGVEVDVLNQEGDLDITKKMDKVIEFVIASCHSGFQPMDEEMFKNTYENIIKNPRVDVIGHLCRTNYFSNLDYIIPLAKEYNKIIEINLCSFKGGNFPPRTSHWAENSKALINKCLEYKAKICVNSDAHICYDVGAVDEVASYLEKINFPEELIMNLNKESVMEYLDNR